MSGRFVTLAVACAMLLSAATRNARTERAQTAVEPLLIDVGVVDAQGRPVVDLTAADFTVAIGGAPRRVRTAEWIPLATHQSSSLQVAPEGYTWNHHEPGGRLIVLAVDQPNVRVESSAALVSSLTQFADRLSPADRVAVVALGPVARATPFAADRDRLKQMIGTVKGARQPGKGNRFSKHGLDPDTAAQIIGGDIVLLLRTINRECGSRDDADSCRAEVIEDAASLLRSLDRQADAAIVALRALLIALQSIDQPKTVVFVSEGFVAHDNDNGMASRLAELGSLAAAAQTGMYVIQLDAHLSNAAPIAGAGGALEDRQLRAQGLQALAASARGAWFSVDADGGAFDRVRTELSGYYLLSVDPESGDLDHGPRRLRIDVSRKGVAVRARRAVQSTPPDAHIGRRSPAGTVAAALAMPVVLPTLPVQVTTVRMRDADPARIAIAIHADIGQAYTTEEDVAAAYVIIDARGLIVEHQSFSDRLAPPISGVASSLPLVAGASLKPGDYLLKLAAAIGDHVGSVEHPIRATLMHLGALALSDLIVGTAGSSEMTRPAVDYTMKLGALRAYIEAYGPPAPSVTIVYEIAAQRDGPALVRQSVAGKAAGESRTVFSAVLPLGSLPPGKYQLRAVASRDGAVVNTVSRAFEIATLGASVSPVRAEVAPAKEFSLSIDRGALATPFHVSEALDADILQMFALRVPADGRSRFDQGIDRLKNGDYAGAAVSFREVVQPDSDATAALAYLGVAYAASGHDVEASSVWQSTLAISRDDPQVYCWLGKALLRTGDLGRARTVFEQASSRWPAQTQFVRPLAMLYAAIGNGRDAIRLLERDIRDGHSDPDTLYLAIGWIFQAHMNGAIVHSPAEDLTEARQYADEYAQAKGAQLSLVRQWLAYLEKERR